MEQNAIPDGPGGANFGGENDSFREENMPDAPYQAEAPVVPPINPLLRPHGQVWKDEGEVTIDVGMSNRRTRLLWPGQLNQLYDGVAKKELEYFKLMFPMSVMQTLLTHTNEQLGRFNKSTTTSQEMLQYFGLRLNMTLDKIGCPIVDFWMTDQEEGSTFVPPNYGRFGMSRHRFQALSRCMRFADYDEGVISEVVKLIQTSPTLLHHITQLFFYQDPWTPIRPFIDAFNRTREKNIYASGNMVIDECMSAWRGFESFECIFVLPHKTKIIRKPEGVGAEIKSLCDGESGILLHLEVMEGKDAQAAKEFSDAYPSSIALTLRITKKYFGTGITVHADSAFGSVSCAAALASRGLYFMGCVKTATKKFPKGFLNLWAQPDNVARGSHKTLKSTILLEDNVTVMPIFAVAWKDLTVKQIVCTRGLTAVQGNPSTRHRRRIVEMEYGHENDRYTLEIPRPQAIEMFYSCFSNIDVHDHYRQGSLAFERSWSTKTWWHRLFMTMFGMICTDAYFGYRLEYNNRNNDDEGSMLTYKKFLYRLAYQLIHSHDEVRNLRRRRGGDDSSSDDDDRPHQAHNLRPLSQSAHYENLKNPGNKNKRAVRRCHIKDCGLKTAYYCEQCSSLVHPIKYVCVCNPFHKRGSTCYSTHCEKDDV